MFWAQDGANKRGVVQANLVMPNVRYCSTLVFVVADAIHSHRGLRWSISRLTLTRASCACRKCYLWSSHRLLLTRRLQNRQLDQSQLNAQRVRPVMQYSTNKSTLSYLR
jgi:hypothetical protein